MFSEEDLFVIVVLFLKLQNSSVVFIDINTKTLTYSSYSHFAHVCTMRLVRVKLVSEILLFKPQDSLPCLIPRPEPLPSAVRGLRIPERLTTTYREST